MRSAGDHRVGDRQRNRDRVGVVDVLLTALTFKTFQVGQPATKIGILPGSFGAYHQLGAQLRDGHLQAAENGTRRLVELIAAARGDQAPAAPKHGGIKVAGVWRHGRSAQNALGEPVGMAPHDPHHRLPRSVRLADSGSGPLGQHTTHLFQFSWVTWLLFIVDYGVRLQLSLDRRRFIRSSIFDLVVIALPILRPLRVLRLLMLLRVLDRRVGTSLRGKVTVYLVGSTALVLFCAALAMLDAERQNARATITDFGDALGGRSPPSDMATTTPSPGKAASSPASSCSAASPSWHGHRDTRVLVDRPGAGG
jgi:hypothetical protein